MRPSERETEMGMASPSSQVSDIQKYFSGAVIFITGGTGFLGRLLVEKLLRTCPDIEKIYMLVRNKKGKDSEQRLLEYFKDSLFERLKMEASASMTKLHIMEGDCSLPDLGLSDQSKEIIISEVKCIFHVAATVRFDEKLRLATYINVRATKDILQLAKKVRGLKSFIHVSTAYSFCPKRSIDEIFYKPPVTDNILLSLVELLDEDKLEEIVPTIIGDWPNTYVYTKAVSESVVQKEGAGLPLAVVRPSIVVATAKEPVGGWIDNYYGATGIFVGTSLGLIRTMQCDPDKLADLIPADYVVNAMIAAAWDIAQRANPSELQGSQQGASYSDIPIYNYVSAPQRPITWFECIDKAAKRASDIGSTLQVWHYIFKANPNKYLHLISHYLLHLLPAYIVDFLAVCIGKKAQMVKVYDKITKFSDAIAYFSLQEWHFRNINTQRLWDKLSSEDKKLYEFDMEALDWEQYSYTFFKGIRVYLLKDPLETIPQGLAKQQKLKVAHYILMSTLLLLLLLVLWKIFSLFL